MKHYMHIFNSDGELVPTKRIQILKRLVRKAKQKTGIFKCQTPGGNTHKWEIQLHERKLGDKKILIRATAKWVTQ